MTTKDKIDVGVAVTTALVSAAALWLSISAGNRAQSADERARIAGERARIADERSLADLVVFHAEAISDSNDPRLISGYILTVSNFGGLPIEGVSVRGGVSHIENVGDIPLVANLGVIRQCSEKEAVAEFGGDAYVIFKDANGRTWSRRPEERPTAASAELEYDNTDLEWKEINLGKCVVGSKP